MAASQNMTVRLCVLGNSHVAALRTAWDSLQRDHPEVEITWFAHRGMGVSNLIPTSESLVPNNDDLLTSIKFTSGRSEVRLADFDAFLVYALHQHGRQPDTSFYSAAVRRQALEDQVTSQRNYMLVQKVRSVTDKPLFVAHDPLPAFGADDVVMRDYPAHVAEMQERFYSPLSATLVEQPSSSVVAGCATKQEFSKDSTRLVVGKDNDGETHGGHDIFHMNSSYGNLWLTSFIPRLRAGS